RGEAERESEHRRVLKLVRTYRAKPAPPPDALLRYAPTACGFPSRRRAATITPPITRAKASETPASTPGCVQLRRTWSCRGADARRERRADRICIPALPGGGRPPCLGRSAVGCD